MADVTIPGPHGPVLAYLATLAAAGPWPGVVVIHDALGMSQIFVTRPTGWRVRDTWPWRPDLFWWGGTMRCLRALGNDLRARKGRAFDDVEAVRTWLAGQDGRTGKIGVIGFASAAGSP